MSPASKKSTLTKSAFSNAATIGSFRSHKFFKPGLYGLGALALVLFLVWGFRTPPAPQGNNLYGLCKAYIQQQLPFPDTYKVLELTQQIPDTEDKRNPQRLNLTLTFSYTNGMGRPQLNNMTCGIRFNADLANTPWQGIYIERVSFEGRVITTGQMTRNTPYPRHDWADTYYPPNQKSPRRADDNNERLEIFYNGIPSLLLNPIDLSLPRYDLDYMSIEDLRDL
jgi:hypothetical protein